MLKVVPLLFAHIFRQLRVVQRVVHRVVHDIHRVRARDDTIRNSRRKDGMGQQQHGKGKNGKENWWHYKAVAVHGQKVVDAVQQKVQQVEKLVSREHAVHVENETMEQVLQERPEDNTKCKATKCSKVSLRRGEYSAAISSELRLELCGRHMEESSCNRQPENWNHIPWRFCKHLEEVVRHKLCWLSAMTRNVYLLEVKLLRE